MFKKYLCFQVVLTLFLALDGNVFAGSTVKISLPDNPTVTQRMEMGTKIILAAHDANVSRIEVGPGVFLFGEGIKLSNRQLEIVGTLTGTGPATVFQFATPKSGYEKTGENVYTLKQPRELIALFQADPQSVEKKWRALNRVKEVGDVALVAGTYHCTNDTLTVHPFDNADPAACIMIPDAHMGILASYGHVIASNIHIRGARNAGVYAYSGILQITDCLLSENGWNGLDTTRQSSVNCSRVAGVNNGNDAFGVHRAGIGTFTQCYGARNGDDGFSPHEEGIMRLVDCVSEHNADRGVVAVQGSQLSLNRCQLYHNGGQNASLEAGAEGILQFVISDTSGTTEKAQPNIRVLNDSHLLMNQVFDRKNAPAEATLYGTGQCDEVPADSAHFDAGKLAYDKLLPKWFFCSTFLDIQP
jgi:hypothetical protein